MASDDASKYNSVYLTIVIIVALLVIGVMMAIGYFVWASNQPPGWINTIKKRLQGYMLPKPDTQPVARSPIGSRRNHCDIINGNILESCRNVQFASEKGLVYAECKKKDETYNPTLLNVDACSGCSVSNIDGNLTCALGSYSTKCSGYGGDWANTCSDFTFNPTTGLLSAKCKSGDTSVPASINVRTCGDSRGCMINNVNGSLRCQK